MISFDEFNLNTPLRNGLADLGFETPTPVQSETFNVIRSGKNVVGIAQTGTGKTLAYTLPLLMDHKFSKETNPRVLILVPTRELVLQVVESIEAVGQYVNVKVMGIFGGSNIKTQMVKVAEGCDFLVATPGRLYDLVLARAIQLKRVKKLVIDEVDVMLDLGFRFQLTNIFELLPERRQNIMFSATMTEDIDLLINDFFIAPEKISIAVSGTPLENIAQSCYAVPNFYTKANLLYHLVRDREEFSKVLVFVSSKKYADRLFKALELQIGPSLGIIHSNKSQNFRINAIQKFEEGTTRVLITTDVMARGLDLDQISHVINFDTPTFPENYMHRIGRTGRAEAEGKTILFFTEKEEPAKKAIEELMDYQIPEIEFPASVEISERLIPDERPAAEMDQNTLQGIALPDRGPAVHEKKAKNKKVNEGGSYKKNKGKKYKKPKTRGDKRQNMKKKKKKR